MSAFVALFPGQGSQAVGMGREFFDADAEAKRLFEEANKALGVDITRLCLEGPIEQLTLTENAQPAILLVSYIAFRLSGLTPGAGAGHSLGEYTALVAAGAIEFSAALRLVQKRGRYMQAAVPEGQGKMIAVLGPTVPEIEEVIKATAGGVKEIANINCPGQTVISGDVPGIDALSEALLKTGAKVIPLKVSAPFHCSLMKPAELQLAGDIENLAVSAPRFPVYANVTAKAVTTPQEIKSLLVQQVCSPVRWTESVEQMVKESGATTSVEFGSGGVLSNLMKRINKGVTRLEISDPASLEKTRGTLG